MEHEQDAQSVATAVVRRLVDAGFETYFAGGWVRDHLLGHDRSDIDIATAAAPEEVINLFDHTVPVGVQFGVVIVVEGEHQFEVSSFRKDGLYVDGRRPEGIEHASAEEDVHRRDFTINGMFYDPLKETIHDWVEGRQDLERRVIRAIGNADHRFQEDRLRMIRAVRMASRFQFLIDVQTEKAILANAATLFPAVAMERIWAEFQKMAESPHFPHALLMMHELQLLQEIFPTLRETPVQSLFGCMDVLDRMPAEAPPICKVMELFPGVDIKEQVAVAQRLKTSNRDAKMIERLGEVRELIEAERAGDAPEQVDWVRFYAHPDAALLIAVALARYGAVADALAPHVARYEQCSEHICRIVAGKPLVASNHLIASGIVPGKRMGQLLREAERIAVNEDLHDSEEVLTRLKESSVWPEGM